MQRRPRDVLDPFHQLHEPFLFARPNRSKTNTAVAGDHSGDAVPARWFEQVVPGGLPVVVRMNVDEAGRHDEPGCIELFDRVAEVGANGRNDAAINREVGDVTGRPGAVDDGPAVDDEVVHASSVPFSTRLANHAPHVRPPQWHVPFAANTEAEMAVVRDICRGLCFEKQG